MTHTEEMPPQGGMAAHGQRVAAMAADPELTGPLLAVGVAMSAIIDAGLDDPLTLKRINNLAFGAPANPSNMAVRYIEVDRRRYVPPERTRECGAPTSRKARCGRKGNRGGYVTDWATGEQSWLEACSKHSDWFERARRENEDARPEVGGPRPYANTGGVLARHFPEVDWHGLWSKVNTKWEPYPEREPVEPAAPTLTVLTEEPPKKSAKPRTTKSDTKAGQQQVRGRGGLYAVPDAGMNTRK